MAVTDVAADRFVPVASLAELRAAGRLVVHHDHHVVCLFADGDEVHAVDNRCPHMGFPLHRGSVCDGILTCHWHHARFDLKTGGTFDQWADELRRFPARVDGDTVLIDLTQPGRSGRPSAGPSAGRARARHPARAREGGARAPRGRRDRHRHRSARGSTSACAGVVAGWFRGLTTLVCFMNLTAAARRRRPSGCALPRAGRRRRRTRSWGHRTSRSTRFRVSHRRRNASRSGSASFVDVRDAEGAERALDLGGTRRRIVERARRHALRGGHRPPLPRRRAHAGLREQGARGARRRGLGCSRGRSRVAARTAGGRRAHGGGECVAQPGRHRHVARGCVRRSRPGARGAASARAMARSRSARRHGARRRGVDDPRCAAGRAPGRRDRGGARLCRHFRSRHADRALPDEQRVRRLGHGAPHVHVRERRRAGAQAVAVRRSFYGVCSTRR